jgi:hypothetical protein
LQHRGAFDSRLLGSPSSNHDAGHRSLVVTDLGRSSQILNRTNRVARWVLLPCGNIPRIGDPISSLVRGSQVAVIGRSRVKVSRGQVTTHQCDRPPAMTLYSFHAMPPSTRVHPLCTGGVEPHHRDGGRPAGRFDSLDQVDDVLRPRTSGMTNTPASQGVRSGRSSRSWTTRLAVPIGLPSTSRTKPCLSGCHIHPPRVDEKIRRLWICRRRFGGCMG